MMWYNLPMNTETLSRGRWLAAVSGGPDSMALLNMCLEKGIAVAAAHVNYHHRAQAEEEEAYVRRFCEEHGIVCHVLNEPFTPEGNFEAAAREWRYAFFVRMVKEYGYSGVLTGHQEDDLIETYLMQREKNAVPEYYGLRDAVMYGGVQVRRPLLEYTKQDLRDYCDSHGITYWLDHTNDSDEYTRNRIRHEEVETMDPFMRRMVRREIDEENARMHEQRCRVHALMRNDAVDVNAYRRLAEDDRLVLLRMIAEPQEHRMSLRHLKEIDARILSGKDVYCPLKQGDLVVDDDEVRLVPKRVPYAFTCADTAALKALEWASFRIAEGKPGVDAVTLTEADFPVVLRSWQDGDSIRMRYGTKSVHRFFIDRHIPHYRRRTWPVLVNRAGDIILVPGLGCDPDHYSASPSLNITAL